MNKGYKILISLFLTLLIILAFTSPLNPLAGGWTQQFMPNLGGRNITDIFFLDSLTGFAATNNLSAGDIGYILKTTDSGYTWSFSFTINRGFTTIKFINIDTGYACGGSGGGTTYLCRTTNAGLNWTLVSSPSAAKWKSMSVLSYDTLWLVDDEGLTGGVFRTTNGGISWERQYYDTNMVNPDRIYMYNARIGFMGRTNNYINKTTNSGVNWSRVLTGDGFRDMKFVDSLTGWKADCNLSDCRIKKTTNGGFSWIEQIVPYGGIINSPGVQKLSVISRDTLWAVGASAFYGAGQFRGVLYRSVNGGINWLFQIPDTSIHLSAYNFVCFVDNKIGWAYTTYGGIHTTTGGDTVWYTGIKQVSSDIPSQFKLYQNYPNPFNPRTIIKYQIVNSKEPTANVKLFVYDITGKEIIKLVDKEQRSGIYEVDFSGNGYSSGVYFYRLESDDFIQAKKMVLVK